MSRTASPIYLLRWLTGWVGVPYLGRPTLRYELLSVLAGSMGLAVSFSRYTPMLAKKALGAAPWMVAALVSAYALGSIVSALLTSVLRRWSPSAVAAACCHAAAALTALAALLPQTPDSALGFTILMVAVAVLWMIQQHVRASIWRANYPASARGSVVSRVSGLTLLLSAALTLGLGAILDVWPWTFRPMLVVGGLSWVASGLLLGRIRVRRDRERARQARLERWVNPLAALSVLRTDRRFAVFMAWQMLLGASVVMVFAVFVQILADTFGANYKVGAAALVTIPMMARLVSLLVGGRLYDRTSIFRFRSVAGGIVAVSRAVLFAGVYFLSLPVMFVSRGLDGFGMGMDELIWRLAPLGFADRHNAHLYIGTHMLLGGLRGSIMPFVGIWLYEGSLGIHVIWVSAVFQVIAVAGFWLSDPGGRHRAKPH